MTADPRTRDVESTESDGPPGVERHATRPPVADEEPIPTGREPVGDRDDRDARVDERFGDGSGNGGGPRGRSVVELLRELSGEGADLVRQEVALAKAEMNEKLDLYQGKLTTMGAGMVLMAAAAVFLLWAINYGLTALLTLWVGLDIAAWLAPLILAVVLLPIGWGMMKSATSSLRDEGVTPRKTLQTLQRDKRWAGREAQKLKEAMRNG